MLAYIDEAGTIIETRICDEPIDHNYSALPFYHTFNS